MLYQTRRSHAIGVLGLLVLLLFVPFSFYSLFIASFHLLILFLTLSISLPFLSIFYLLLISFQFSNCLLKKLEKKFQYTIITYSEEVCHEYYPVFCFFSFLLADMLKQRYWSSQFLFCTNAMQTYCFLVFFTQLFIRSNISPKVVSVG